VHASACGTVLILLAMLEDRRDLNLSENARAWADAACRAGSESFTFN
jgi:hypothetical protein